MAKKKTKAHPIYWPFQKFTWIGQQKPLKTAEMVLLHKCFKVLKVLTTHKLFYGQHSTKTWVSLTKAVNASSSTC